MPQFSALPLAGEMRRVAEAASPLIIQARVTIVGALIFDGPILVEGSVDGEIRCRSLTVSERAVIDGLIVADSVTIAGDVNGSIYANTLLLKSACSVEGEIYHREINLEAGSYFEGKSRRHASPLRLAPPMDKPLAVE
jgi:cytoskeletal protein CcmA (bactofilin family)